MIIKIDYAADGFPAMMIAAESEAEEYQVRHLKQELEQFKAIHTSWDDHDSVGLNILLTGTK